ncbi:MAG TPA: FAD-linked oxidase C-terminal domain-containing protein [Gemmatales bacterium]|nr:FAD-linked oxidase C-terminal domain-containing protein [Gemmatales bacterium]
MQDLYELQRQALARHLRKETTGEVHSDPITRDLYSTDASIYQIPPVAVFLPRTANDLRIAVQISRDHHVPIVPRGGGTSLSGQAIGPGLVIDASKHLRRIIEIDTANHTARVQPGVVLEQLNQAAGKHGLMFGPDVSTANRATLGGMIGNNSAGSHSIVHGLTVNHVLSLDVVLSDGTTAKLATENLQSILKQDRSTSLIAGIYRTLRQIISKHHDAIRERFPRILRRVSGYNLDRLLKSWEQGCINLAELMVGSEGTLALTTEAEVKLVDKPRYRGLLVPHFTSIAAALDSLDDCLAIQPSAVEMMDQMILDLARNNLALQRRMQAIVGRPAAIFMVEASGNDRQEVEDRLRKLEARLRHNPGVSEIVQAIDDDEREPLWRLRESGLPLLMGLPGDRKPITFVEDTAVSPEKLPQFVAEFQEIMQRHNTFGAIYGHASVGCLHIRPVLNLKDASDVKTMRQISTEVSDLVLKYHGSLSGEHGDGLARSEWLPKMFGKDINEAFKQIKKACDPEGLFNPGKIVDPPPMDQQLRYVREGEAPAELTSTNSHHHKQPLPQVMLDYSPQTSILQHVELCSGTGVCRKTSSGTMCPSYRATLDEKDSTRGRGNILRLAFQNTEPLDALASPAVQEVLDLCLSCKACKAECPSNVDMAKLKAEATHHYYQHHRRPMADRIQRNLPTLLKLGSKFAPILNEVINWSLVRWGLHRWGGLARRRSVPRLRRDHFRKWFAQHRKKTTASENKIILWDDCFTTFSEPEIGIAAVTLIEALGFSVELAEPICCGRPLISKGYLTEARNLVQKQMGPLYRRIKSGVPLLGLEPSCLLTLVDEWPQLVPGRVTRLIAEQASLAETWVAGQRTDFRPLAGKCVVHGHCHQKALVGMDKTVAALRKIPALQVTPLDTGCCGMAGAFGYEKHHYDLSVNIAQPLLDQLADHPDALVLANGTSCRHQLRDISAVHPLHPIELLAQQVGTLDHGETIPYI